MPSSELYLIPCLVLMSLHLIVWSLWRRTLIGLHIWQMTSHRAFPRNVLLFTEAEPAPSTCAISWTFEIIHVHLQTTFQISQSAAFQIHFNKIDSCSCLFLRHSMPKTHPSVPTTNLPHNICICLVVFLGEVVPLRGGCSFNTYVFQLWEWRWKPIHLGFSSLFSYGWNWKQVGFVTQGVLHGKNAWKRNEWRWILAYFEVNCSHTCNCPRSRRFVGGCYIN